MPTQLQYIINTTPNPLTVGTSSGILTILASNNSVNPVSVQGITINIPIRTAESALTNSPNNIKYNLPIGWKADQPNISPGHFTFVFVPTNGQSISIPNQQSIVFTLTEIDISIEGIAELIITEGSTGDPTQSVNISKFPARWGDINFRAIPPTLQNKGDVTLTWSGPAAAEYQIKYVDPETQQPITIPTQGQPPLSNSGTYPEGNDPPLTIDATTIFTLVVSAVISGQKYQTLAQQTVTVGEVPTVKLSGTMCGTPANPEINLIWTSSANATQVLASWTNDILSPNPSQPSVIKAPFDSSYSVVAVAAGGRKSEPSTVELNWTAIGSIDDGAISSGATFTPDSKLAFLVNGSGKTASVVDMSSLKITDTVALTNNPQAMLITLDGKYGIVPVTGPDIIGSDAFWFVDIASLTVTHKYPVRGIGSMALTPDGQFALLQDYANQQLHVMQLSDFSIPQTIKLDQFAGQIAVTHNGKYALILNGQNVEDYQGYVSVVDLTSYKITTKIMAEKMPDGIGITPDDNYAFVANQASNNVTIMDLSSMSVVTNIATGVGPSGIAITADNSMAFVSNTGPDYSSMGKTVSVISIPDFKVIDNIIVGLQPGPMAIVSNGSYLMVVNENDGTVSQIDIKTLKVVQTISVSPSLPSSIKIAPNGLHGFVTGFGNPSVLGMGLDNS